MMKRTVLLLILPILLCSAIGVDKALSEITQGLAEGKRISATYAIAWSDQGTSLLLSGKAIAEGNGFRIEGNGTQIYCDGVSLWIVDPESKEVYIQSASTLSDFISSKITSIKDFTLSEVKTSKPKENPDEFVFFTDKLSDEWIVTDLRQ